MSGDMSSDTAYLFAYGTYLSNGGTHDGFMDLSDSEIQLIYTVTMARQERQVKDTVMGIAKVLGKMFCGDE